MVVWSDRLVGFLVFALCCAAPGCAYVTFEKSPYAVRGLDIVYSRQEDATFFSWRLRRTADPRSVTFELYQDGDFQPIDLADTLFPADPYECGKTYLCFQYQLPGRYTWPEDVRPLRSVHDDEGLYAGAVPVFQQVDITFGIDPIALGRNERIDPRRYDWFADNGVPLERAYEWQLTESSRATYKGGDTSQCGGVAAAEWGEMGATVAPASPEWVERPRCMASRPVRTDAAGVVRNVPFTPSAVLAGEQQDYVPLEERPPIIYAYLIDTLIKSQTRCDRAISGIASVVDEKIGERAPGSIRLGSFTPLDPQTGRPRSGCEQASDQDYPVRQIVEALKQAAAGFEPQRVRFVLIYINNVDLPVSERVQTQLQELLFEVNSIENVLLYGWAIGSNLVIDLFGWDDSLGWAPIDDEIFIEDLKAWGDRALPFRTMLHDDQTEILINKPVTAVARPNFFKMCATTPEVVVGVGLGDGQIAPAGEVYYPWPESGSPHYWALLDEQVLIENGFYQRVRVSSSVETCERFCDMPFRASSGTDYTNWLETERCQWK